MITFVIEKNPRVSRYYALRGNLPVAMIEKFKNDRSTINPFKVSLKTHGSDVYKPYTAFWPKGTDLSIGKTGQGYFKDAHGNLADAKALIHEICG